MADRLIWQTTPAKSLVNTQPRVLVSIAAIAMPISQYIVIPEYIKNTSLRQRAYYINIRHPTDDFWQLLALLSPYLAFPRS
jgi:hypothetical protein